MTTPPNDPGTENDAPNTDNAPEVNEGETFTAADRAALQKALKAERTLHRSAVAKLAEVEATSATENDKAWMEKMAVHTAASDSRVKKIAARAALSTAGLQGSPSRLVSLLDLNEVTVDDDGEVVGLDDQVKLLKTEYPGLFAATEGATKTKPAVGKLEIGGRTAAPTKPKSSAQRLAEQIIG